MSSIRLKHASGNSMSLAAPGTNPASNLELKLPHTIGSANQLLKVDGSGQLGWATDNSGVSLSGSTNNTIATVTGANALIGESSLTFDGTTLMNAGGTFTAERGVVPSIEAKNSTDTSYARFYCSQTSGSGGYAAFQKLGTNSSAIGGANATQIWCTGDAPLVIGVNNAERLRIDSSGLVAMGGNANLLDSVLSITNSVGDCIRLRSNTTNNTFKYGVIKVDSYGNSSNGVQIIGGKSDSSYNEVAIGGGVDTGYAATHIKFHTAANTTTQPGSERLRIDSSGHLLHGVTSDENTSGNGGFRFINAGDIQIDGDQKALVFRSANSTAQVQSGIEWWNENGAGVQAKIICDRTAIQKAPSDIVFFTNTDVDTSANSSEGDVTEHFRITSVGKLQRRSLGTQTNPALSAQHLYENGITTDGNYYLQSASMTAPALVRCVFHDNRGWMILMQHECVNCDGLYLSHLENKVGTPNHATSDFQGCAQTDGLNMTPLNMWEAFGPNAEDSRMAMYAREIQTSSGRNYDETQTYSGYVGNPIFNQVSFKRLFSGNFSNGTFETGVRVTHNDGASTVYSKKGITWSSPSLATINNGVVDEDLYFCNGADDGDTNWSFGLMQGGTPYPRLAGTSDGGGRNSVTRWAIIGICEK